MDSISCWHECVQTRQYNNNSNDEQKIYNIGMWTIQKSFAEWYKTSTRRGDAVPTYSTKSKSFLGSAGGG